MVSPPSVWNRPGSTTRPDSRLLRPTKPATKRSAGRSYRSRCVPTWRTEPSDITTRRSAMISASSWSCVTITVVMPSLLLQLADLHAHRLAQLGVEVRQRLVEQQHVGPDDQRARQRDALLLAARELRAAGARRGRPGAPGAAPRRRAARSRTSAPCASRARRRRSRPPSDAGTARSSGTPCRRCASTAAASVTSLPPRRTRPAVGAMKPAIMRSVVVLPQPLGPSSTTNSPSRTSSETSCTATVAPKCLVRRFDLEPRHGLHDPRQLDEAVGDDHRRADQQDLQHRHRRDRRIDAVFEVLQDR